MEYDASGNEPMNNGDDRKWIRDVLARIEDHIHEMRRFQNRSDKKWEDHQRRWEENHRRWERNERRWWANHRVLVHMLEEIRRLKKTS